MAGVQITGYKRVARLVATACSGVAETNSLDKQQVWSQARINSRLVGVRGDVLLRTLYSWKSECEEAECDKRSHQVAWWLMAVALLCLAPSVFAGTVSLRLNDPPSNNVLDGIYVGAYGATIMGSGQAQIICDDFKDGTPTTTRRIHRA